METPSAMDMECRVDADNPHVRKFQKELSAGSVALVLLAVIGRADEPLYGYQIAKRLEAADPDLAGGKQGAFYPVLRSLSAAGLLDSTVEPSISGPPRKYYRITDEGRAVLAAWKTTWTRMKTFIDSALTEA